MPFSHRDKELLGGGTSVRMFGYRAKETLSQASEPDYFKYWGELLPGDWLFINAVDGNMMAVVQSLNPTLIAAPDAIPHPKPPQGKKDINELRQEAKGLGLNTWGKGRAEIEAMIVDALPEQFVA